ncbi:MAG: hypothetical protein ABSB19_06285 [Methylomonas sp.]|jgi:hypothetical protein
MRSGTLKLHLAIVSVVKGQIDIHPMENGVEIFQKITTISLKLLKTQFLISSRAREGVGKKNRLKKD